jgi:cullin-associated NEDD8-dissociated protein 1
MPTCRDLSSRSRRQVRRLRGFYSSTRSRRSAFVFSSNEAQLTCQVILHSSPAQLESLADHSWSPLFAQDSSESTSDIGEDSARNVKAACIGKLTTAAPHKFLPELQALLTSSPRDRALVAAAVRYTFIDTSSSYDELIAPVIVDFLSLVHDENVVSS